MGSEMCIRDSHCRLPTLNEDAKQICEGVLTKTECFKALQTFKNGKSPGNDGLTAEFYQAFWPTLGHLLVDSLNSSFEKGEMSNSQKQGIIRLIEKKSRTCYKLETDLSVECRC